MSQNEDGAAVKMRLQPGDIVQHFKREMLNEEERAGRKYLYEIVGVAYHSETMEKMMVYRPLYGDMNMFVRPLDMFLGEVDHEKYPYVRQKYRFEKVSDVSADGTIDKCLNTLF